MKKQPTSTSNVKIIVGQFYVPPGENYSAEQYIDKESVKKANYDVKVQPQVEAIWSNVNKPHKASGFM
jgi:hypothetical protein